MSNKEFKQVTNNTVKFNNVVALILCIINLSTNEWRTD